jgi:hypothetical protein
MQERKVAGDQLKKTSEHLPEGRCSPQEAFPLLTFGKCVDYTPDEEGKSPLGGSGIIPLLVFYSSLNTRRRNRMDPDPSRHNQRYLCWSGFRQAVATAILLF